MSASVVAGPRLRHGQRPQSAPRRAETGADRLLGFAGYDYATRSWDRKRRVVARRQATPRGFDARYVVTSRAGGPLRFYEGVSVRLSGWRTLSLNSRKCAGNSPSASMRSERGASPKAEFLLTGLR